MMDETYNLVDESWICLLSKDGKVTKEGLRTVFLNAQNYLDLGGEIRLQDMAVLRLLISISVTLLYRYNKNGERSDLSNSSEALQRFSEVFKAGRFSEKAVNAYFEEWHDRFDLFSKERPFFQLALNDIEWIADKECPDGKKPLFSNGVFMKWLPIANINGRIQRSDNKPNAPYKDLSGSAADEAEADEAARWLLFYNAYADCSVGKRQNFIDELGKKQSGNAEMTLPSKGSLITPVGKNLFETIMLNSVLFDPDRHELYEKIHPVWEENGKEPEIIKGRPIPNDLARIYTQQARRISLVKKEGKVIGAFASAGESYSSDQLWMEPAFMIHLVKDKDTKQLIQAPMQSKNNVDIWREVEHIAGDNGAPISRWIKLLDEILPEDDVIPFRVTGISYGSMNCGIQSMTEDRIILSRQFVEDTELQDDAVKEIKRIDEISKIIRAFGADCAKCMNLDAKDKRIEGLLSEQYYGAVGHDFRKFLSGNMTLKDLRNAEFDSAKRTVDQYIEYNIKALLRGKMGENGMYLGKSEASFKASIAKLERKTYG